MYSSHQYFFAADNLESLGNDDGKRNVREACKQGDPISVSAAESPAILLSNLQ